MPWLILQHVLFEKKLVQGSKGGRRVDFGEGHETYMGNGPRFH